MTKRNVFIWMKKYVASCVVFLLCMSLCYHAVSAILIPDDIVVSRGEEEYKPVIILDAGHGGEDCGAIGVNGVYEKDLNLTIANFVGAKFKEAGYTVIQTRTEDKLLYDPATVEKGHKKSTDLANRVQMVNGHEAAILVSIHMNSYPASNVRGLQVWYGEQDEKGRVLANTIQNYMKANLQMENKRVAKSSGGKMYMLDMSTCPSVLVECGFLTCEEECAMLCEENYQKELSNALFCAIIEYITKKEVIS